MNGRTAALSASAIPSNSVHECDLSPAYSVTATGMSELVADELALMVCAACRLSAPSACSIRCCSPIHCANSTAIINNAAKQSRVAVGARDESAGFKKTRLFVGACVPDQSTIKAGTRGLHRLRQILGPEQRIRIAVASRYKNLVLQQNCILQKNKARG